MPNVTITIGGRAFQVACNEGEESYLQTAAAMLDNEASGLVEQAGHMPENQLLLMSGLMLADKTAGLEDHVKALEVKLVEARSEVSAEPSSEDLAALDDIVQQAERLAEEMEAKAAPAAQDDAPQADTDAEDGDES